MASRQIRANCLGKLVEGLTSSVLGKKLDFLSLCPRSFRVALKQSYHWITANEKRKAEHRLRMTAEFSGL